MKESARTPKEMLAYIEESENLTLEASENQRLEVTGEMYDLAGRKCALVFVKFFRKHPYLVSDCKAMSCWKVIQLLDPDLREEMDDIGPSGFMAVWAKGNALYSLGYQERN